MNYTFVNEEKKMCLKENIKIQWSIHIITMKSQYEQDAKGKKEMK